MLLAGKYGAAEARILLCCPNNIDGMYRALPLHNKCSKLVTVQRITLFIKAPVLLGCKQCSCHSQLKIFTADVFCSSFSLAQA